MIKKKKSTYKECNDKVKVKERQEQDPKQIHIQSWFSKAKIEENCEKIAKCAFQRET